MDRWSAAHLNMIETIDKASSAGRALADWASALPPHDSLARVERLTTAGPESMLVPYHSLGVCVAEIPDRLYPGLLEIVHAATWGGVPRIPDGGGGLVQSVAGLGASCVSPGQAAFMNTAHASQEIVSLVQAFAGVEVEPTEWYGPRIYHRGARLLRHCDRARSHVFGVTAYIESSDHQPWPIYFERDRDFLRISLRIGQMAIYEGVRLPHFRPTALDARFFAAAFLHYRPAHENPI